MIRSALVAIALVATTAALAPAAVAEESCRSVQASDVAPSKASGASLQADPAVTACSDEGRPSAVGATLGADCAQRYFREDVGPVFVESANSCSYAVGVEHPPGDDCSQVTPEVTPQVQTGIDGPRAFAYVCYENGNVREVGAVVGEACLDRYIREDVGPAYVESRNSCHYAVGITNTTVTT